MLRRVVSHARRLGIEGDVMPRLVETTAAMLGETYPELAANRSYVEQVATSEEERFAGTLRQGMTLFETEAAKPDRGGTLPGDVVFKLHDTFGFPKELTRELVEDYGLSIDEDRFETLMAEQKERAKKAAKKVKSGEDVAAVASESGRTEFVGYQSLASDGRVLALLTDAGRAKIAGEGEMVRLILDRSPFYAESGGQVGDRGWIRTHAGVARVTDAQWGPGDVIVHTGVIESGEVRDGEEAHAEVELERREATTRAHTATHVIHWTLKHVLGDHARQAGSLVAPGRLRFDFPHHSAVPREVLEQAEEIANGRLSRDDSVRIYETTFDEAKNQGAVALFGEKYGEFVRVVEVGDYSIELCGGTHVARTGNVAVVRILGEASIGAGMRRIEALVGPDALREVNLERRLFEEVVAALGAGDPRLAPARARELAERVKRLESELGKIRKGDVAMRAEEVAALHSMVAGVRLVAEKWEGDADELRELAQSAVGRLESEAGAAVVLGSGGGGKALLVAACSKNLVGRGVTAPLLLERAARAIGGGAGGKPILGFAGGPKGSEIEEAIVAIPARLEELLSADG
jgi:alanyl-tRNA synthetase